MDGHDAEVRRLAYVANQVAYNTRSEQRYIAGAPHIKHEDVRRLLAEIAQDVLGYGRSVLDIAGGSGLASFPWIGRGLEVTVVDSSDEMLKRYALREPTAHVITADVTEWLSTATEQFDLVALVSALHHIPDYLAVLAECVRLVSPGGGLLTFQDPLLYSRQRRIDHWGSRMAYYSWRATQGGYRKGLRTLSRRIGGKLDPSELADVEEYHVVRDGVDEEAVRKLLSGHFQSVRVVRYWSTQGGPQQWIGSRLGLKAQFATVAKGRK